MMSRSWTYRLLKICMATIVLSISLLCTSLTLANSVQPSRTSARDAYTPPRANPYAIRIDSAKPSLGLYVGGKLYRIYPIALGKVDSETPIGSWRIVNKQAGWGSGFGTRWLGLNVPWGIYGIHGTNRPESIGKYASHGCIRMLNADVEALYDLVPVGTPVIITGNPLKRLRTIVDGNIGADVQLVQTRLKQTGFYRGPCYGKFDSGTQFALMYFQLSRRIPMDGVVDYDDYQALGLVQARARR